MSVISMTVPWMPLEELPKKAIIKAYAKCKRGDPGHCINTNFERAFAEYLGRVVRAPMTLKGMFLWSELVEKTDEELTRWAWARFEAPLTPKYAKMTDDFDHDKKHFEPPKRSPYGPVRLVEWCKVRQPESDEVKAERKAKHIDRVKSGKHVSRSKFRERQLPFVTATR